MRKENDRAAGKVSQAVLARSQEQALGGEGPVPLWWRWGPGVMAEQDPKARGPASCSDMAQVSLERVAWGDSEDPSPGQGRQCRICLFSAASYNHLYRDLLPNFRPRPGQQATWPT